MLLPTSFQRPCSSAELVRSVSDRLPSNTFLIDWTTIPIAATSWYNASISSSIRSEPSLTSFKYCANRKLTSNRPTVPATIENGSIDKTGSAQHGGRLKRFLHKGYPSLAIGRNNLVDGKVILFNCSGSIPDITRGRYYIRDDCPATDADEAEKLA